MPITAKKKPATNIQEDFIARVYLDCSAIRQRCGPAGRAALHPGAPRGGLASPTCQAWGLHIKMRPSFGFAGYASCIKSRQNGTKPPPTPMKLNSSPENIAQIARQAIQRAWRRSACNLHLKTSNALPRPRAPPRRTSQAQSDYGGAAQKWGSLISRLLSAIDTHTQASLPQEARGAATRAKRPHLCPSSPSTSRN
jgi:hypothetical protein